ncbi:UDP-N-acetylglucosamine-peptide N-acetylglucosaminyltransferase [Variovorax sp. YR752]|uniref:O-linked N-acetylglucosamine transferase, SPINDLY family protein n=1 Tax=Variovorax sp. YR752 TaxID=1884383 RepID=UPI003137C4C0
MTALAATRPPATDARALTQRGVELQGQGRHQDAVNCFMQSLALKIDDAFTHYRLGISFRDCGMKLEAAECIRTAIALGFDDALFARGLLVYLEREGCRWASADAEWRALETALAARPEGAALQVNPFVHAVLSDDPMLIKRVAAHYARFIQSFVTPLPPRRAQAHAGPLRIAYLSADFQQHATAQLMVQMLEAHDRSRVEVTLVSAGAGDGSAMRRRLQGACHCFEDVHGASHDAMARRIRELGIDILVDVKGATDGTLLPVLAARPAPMQLNWLAFPGTSGADFIDYVIGDAVVTPLAHEARYTEKIAQLPGCYQPNDARRARPAPARRADAGLPEGATVLCAFHQSYKISAAVFDRWCEMLQRLPDAVLWLLEWNANVRESLIAAAAARGIGTERLRFAPLLPLDEHLARLACADVFLDAWPCNAHTTAGEALWMGVPVVTVIGETFAQRVASSLLNQVGLDELVCRDAHAYVEAVVGLAGDAPRRTALREHLLRQRDGRLFDGERFARDIEALYERLWQRACAGAPPAHLPA